MVVPSVTNIKFLVEVPFLLVTFAYMFADTINTHLIIYRTCYVTLNYNESDCALLGTNYTDDVIAELEKHVQPHTTIIFTISSIMHAIFPPVMCFFLGPWTDTYGRKPLLLITIAGCGIAFLIVLTISTIQYASPWLLLLYSIPNCIFGGFPTLFAVVLCYITDVTAEEHRGIRLGIFEGVFVLGTLIGTSSSSFVLNSFGYITVYATCLACALFGWVYTFIVIHESVVDIKSEDKFRKLFRFSLLKAAINATIKKREQYKRAFLLIIILMMVLAMFTYYGNKGILFLFLRRKFYWTLEKFTLYSTITDAIAIIGAVIAIFILQKILHINETIVILFGFVTTLSSVLFQGLASMDWHIYGAGAIKCLGGAINPMARCLLSKIIPTEDSGKIFSLLIALESIGAFTGVTIYTMIYDNTLMTHPETFNFVSCGIYVFEILLVIIVLVIQRYHHKVAFQNVLESESVKPSLNSEE